MLVVVVVVCFVLFFDLISTVLLIIPAYNKALISNPARLKFRAFGTIVEIKQIWKRIRASGGGVGRLLFFFSRRFFLIKGGKIKRSLSEKG